MLWEPRAPLSTPRRLLAAAVHDGRIYTFGGCGSPCFQPPFHTSTFEETRVEVYDPGTNSWSVGAPLPAILFGAAAAAPGNDRIYVLGGQLTGNLTQEYDPAADSWALRAPLPTPRHGLAAVALGGRVYALGGSGPTGAVEVYDPATDSWSARAPLPTPRVFLAAAVLDGRIYAVGGSPDCCGSARTAAVEVYDPAADAWTAAVPLPVAMQVSAAAALGGKLYVFGGFIPGQGARAATFVYDPAVGAWSAGPELPRGRDQAPTAVLGRCAHLVGGSVSCHCQPLADHERLCAGDDDPRQADLGIVKDDGVARICPGEAVTYAIEAANHGPADVAGARVRDDFPPGLTDVTWSCAASGGARCGAVDGAGPIDQLVDLPAGGAVAYVAGGTVAPDFCGRLVNAATVEPPAGVGDPALGNDRATDRDGPRGVELEIAAGNGVERVRTGDTVTYTVRVGNPGRCPTAARVRDDFPGLTGVAWSCAPSGGARCGEAGGSGPIDQRVHLPTGGEATYTATGLVAAVSGTTLCNTATAEAPCASAESTDCDPVDPVPVCSVDLSIVADPPTLTATAGDLLRYRWRVTNSGPDAAAGAPVRAIPPPVFADAPAWSCSPAARCTPEAGAGVLASRVDLLAGETVTFTVEGRLRPDVACSFVAAATVEPPPRCVSADPAAGRATADLVVFPPPPGMRACKTVTGDPVPGGTVRYRIVLLNPGPFAQADNRGSELVDLLPAALIPTETTASAGTVRVEARTLIWDGPVPAGGTVTIDLAAAVVGAFPPPLCNQGKVFSDPDGDGDNDRASTTDDPFRAGAHDPTCLEPSAPPAIPTLPATGLLALAALLAAAALARLRSARRA